MPGIARSLMMMPGRNARDLAQRLFAVGRGVGDEAPGAHEFGQPVARRRIVFDEQQTLAETRGAWRR